MIARALAALLTATLAGEAPPSSWTLRDPVKGAEVALRPGPGLTHLVFFATWCPPCLEELPRLAELQASWGRQGYQVVLVAVSTRQPEDRLVAFREAHSPPGELLLDSKGEVQKAFGVEHLPTHVLLDPHGTVLLTAPSLREGVVPAIERALSRGPRKRG